MVNGEHIRRARLEAHLSQAKLAERLGVAELTVYRWEHGIHSRLEYGTVLALARELGVPAEDLLQATNGSDASSGTPEDETARPHDSAQTLEGGPDARGA